MHGTRHVYGSVLRGAFAFAVFPKKLIAFNPMQYVVNRNATDNYELFTETRTEQASVTKTISEMQYLQLIEILASKNNPAMLPIQIAYYTGLRLGEACSLTWQDIDLDEQYITVRRSICYSNTLKKPSSVLQSEKRCEQFILEVHSCKYSKMQKCSSWRTNKNMVNCISRTTTRWCRTKTGHTMRCIHIP